MPLILSLVHSPGKGTIKKAYVIDGTYYSENLRRDMTSDPIHHKVLSPKWRQGNSFSSADNQYCLMCFMPVGMVEVSTRRHYCIRRTVCKKGQEIGMFHFGGSTHCLIFSTQSQIGFWLSRQTPGLNSSNIPINSRIATVLSNWPFVYFNQSKTNTLLFTRKRLFIKNNLLFSQKERNKTSSTK